MEGGPPCFPRDSSCPAVLRILLALLRFRLRVSHTLRMAFPRHSANSVNALCSPLPRKYFYSRFGLLRVRSPLLAQSLLISFPHPTRCFSSGGSPHTPIYSVYDTYLLGYVSFLIQTSAALRIFAPPRSFSQLITSFFGSRCQGIRPALFLA